MIHIRNCLTPTYGADSGYYRFSTWFHREVLLVGRWTEIENDGGAAWDANYSATYSDLIVDPSEPSRVRKASGSFSTPPTGSALSLYDADNDANCVIANILNTELDCLLLDSQNLARPWVAATGLTGKVHTYGQASLPLAAAYSVLAAPGSEPDRFQVKLEVGTTANRPWIYGYPKGDYLTQRRATAGLTWAYGGTERRARINADIDGDHFMMWVWVGYTSAGFGVGPLLWCGGKLTDTADGDDYPYFITGNVNASTYAGVYPSWDWCQSWPLQMLGYFDEPVTGYLENLKDFSNSTYGSSLFHLDRWYSSRGKFARQYPWVYMGDVATGGYRRGRFPRRVIHESWVDWMLSEASGENRAPPGKMEIPYAGSDGCDLTLPVTYMP